jgi:hypothetical protein
MSMQTDMQAGPRLSDMTPADVQVLADQAKERGLGVTPVGPNGPVPLGYLCWCPKKLEAAFAKVFPHQWAKVRAFNVYSGRYTYLFEEAAILAVLTAFGLGPARRERHVHRWHGGTHARVLRRPRQLRTPGNDTASHA